MSEKLPTSCLVWFHYRINDTSQPTLTTSTPSYLFIECPCHHHPPCATDATESANFCRISQFLPFTPTSQGEPACLHRFLKWLSILRLKPSVAQKHIISFYHLTPTSSSTCQKPVNRKVHTPTFNGMPFNPDEKRREAAQWIEPIGRRLEEWITAQQKLWYSFTLTHFRGWALTLLSLFR